MPSFPPPPRAPLGHCVLDLLAHSRDCLGESVAATAPAERYVAAHLAALRAGAAVLAARTRPPRRRRSGPRDVWTVLTEVAPELGEWAAFFAAGADKRAAAAAGLARVVTAREADDLLREAEAFLGLVTAVLGLPRQEGLDPLADLTAPLRAG
jgi:hypothetical protein